MAGAEHVVFGFLQLASVVLTAAAVLLVHLWALKVLWRLLSSSEDTTSQTEKDRQTRSE